MLPQHSIPYFYYDVPPEAAARNEEAPVHIQNSAGGYDAAEMTWTQLANPDNPSPCVLWSRGRANGEGSLDAANLAVACHFVLEGEEEFEYNRTFNVVSKHHSTNMSRFSLGKPDWPWCQGGVLSDVDGM